MGDAFRILWSTPDTTPAARVADRVAAGLCALGALLYPFVYGVRTVGLAGFYLALQSGVLHAVRVVGYEFAASVRYITVGLAFGVCLSIHAFLRALRADADLEYVGGAPVTRTVHGVVVGLNHVVVPLTALVHLRGVPPVNPLWPMLLVAAEVSAIALLHELVAPDPRDLAERNGGARLLLSSIVSSAAWTLFFETIDRFWLRRVRREAA